MPKHRNEFLGSSNLTDMERQGDDMRKFQSKDVKLKRSSISETVPSRPSRTRLRAIRATILSQDQQQETPQDVPKFPTHTMSTTLHEQTSLGNSSQKPVPTQKMSNSKDRQMRNIVVQAEIHHFVKPARHTEMDKQFEHQPRSLKRSIPSKKKNDMTKSSVFETKESIPSRSVVFGDTSKKILFEHSPEKVKVIDLATTSSLSGFMELVNDFAVPTRPVPKKSSTSKLSTTRTRKIVRRGESRNRETPIVTPTPTSTANSTSNFTSGQSSLSKYKPARLRNFLFTNQTEPFQFGAIPNRQISRTSNFSTSEIMNPSSSSSSSCVTGSESSECFDHLSVAGRRKSSEFLSNVFENDADRHYFSDTDSEIIMDLRKKKSGFRKPKKRSKEAESVHTEKKRRRILKRYRTNDTETLHSGISQEEEKSRQHIVADLNDFESEDDCDDLCSESNRPTSKNSNVLRHDTIHEKPKDWSLGRRFVQKHPEKCDVQSKESDSICSSHRSVHLKHSMPTEPVKNSTKLQIRKEAGSVKTWTSTLIDKDSSRPYVESSSQCPKDLTKPSLDSRRKSVLTSGSNSYGSNQSLIQQNNCLKTFERSPKQSETGKSQPLSFGISGLSPGIILPEKNTQKHFQPKVSDVKKTTDPKSKQSLTLPTVPVSAKSVSPAQYVQGDQTKVSNLKLTSDSKSKHSLTHPTVPVLAKSVSPTHPMQGVHKDVDDLKLTSAPNSKKFSDHRKKSISARSVSALPMQGVEVPAASEESQVKVQGLPKSLSLSPCVASHSDSAASGTNKKSLKTRHLRSPLSESKSVQPPVKDHVGNQRNQGKTSVSLSESVGVDPCRPGLGVDHSPVKLQSLKSQSMKSIAKTSTLSVQSMNCVSDTSALSVRSPKNVVETSKLTIQSEKHLSEASETSHLSVQPMKSGAESSTLSANRVCSVSRRSRAEKHSSNISTTVSDHVKSPERQSEQIASQLDDASIDPKSTGDCVNRLSKSLHHVPAPLTNDLGTVCKRNSSSPQENFPSPVNKSVRRSSDSKQNLNKQSTSGPIKVVKKLSDVLPRKNNSSGSKKKNQKTQQKSSVLSLSSNSKHVQLAVSEDDDNERKCDKKVVSESEHQIIDKDYPSSVPTGLLVLGSYTHTTKNLTSSSLTSATVTSSKVSTEPGEGSSITIIPVKRPRGRPSKIRQKPIPLFDDVCLKRIWRPEYTNNYNRKLTPFVVMSRHEKVQKYITLELFDTQKTSKGMVLRREERGSVPNNEMFQDVHDVSAVTLVEECDNPVSSGIVQDCSLADNHLKGSYDLNISKGSVECQDDVMDLNKVAEENKSSAVLCESVEMLKDVTEDSQWTEAIVDEEVENRDHSNNSPPQFEKQVCFVTEGHKEDKCSGNISVSKKQLEDEENDDDVGDLEGYESPSVTVYLSHESETDYASGTNADACSSRLKDNKVKSSGNSFVQEDHIRVSPAYASVLKVSEGEVSAMGDNPRSLHGSKDCSSADSQFKSSSRHDQDISDCVDKCGDNVCMDKNNVTGEESSAVLFERVEKLRDVTEDCQGTVATVDKEADDETHHSNSTVEGLVCLLPEDLKKDSCSQEVKDDNENLEDQESQSTTKDLRHEICDESETFAVKAKVTNSDSCVLNSPEGEVNTSEDSNVSECHSPDCKIQTDPSQISDKDRMVRENCSPSKTQCQNESYNNLDANNSQFAESSDVCEKDDINTSFTQQDELTCADDTGELSKPSSKVSDSNDMSDLNQDEDNVQESDNLVSKVLPHADKLVSDIDSLRFSQVFINESISNEQCTKNLASPFLSHCEDIEGSRQCDEVYGLKPGLKERNSISWCLSAQPGSSMEDVPTSEPIEGIGVHPGMSVPNRQNDEDGSKHVLEFFTETLGFCDELKDLQRFRDEVESPISDFSSASRDNVSVVLPVKTMDLDKESLSNSDDVVIDLDKEEHEIITELGNFILEIDKDSDSVLEKEPGTTNNAAGTLGFAEEGSKLRKSTAISDNITDKNILTLMTKDYQQENVCESLGVTFDQCKLSIKVCLRKNFLDLTHFQSQDYSGNLQPKIILFNLSMKEKMKIGKFRLKRVGRHQSSTWQVRTRAVKTYQNQNDNLARSKTKASSDTTDFGLAISKQDVKSKTCRKNRHGSQSGQKHLVSKSRPMKVKREFVEKMKGMPDSKLAQSILKKKAFEEEKRSAEQQEILPFEEILAIKPSRKKSPDKKSYKKTASSTSYDDFFEARSPLANSYEPSSTRSYEVSKKPLFGNVSRFSNQSFKFGFDDGTVRPEVSPKQSGKGGLRSCLLSVFETGTDLTGSSSPDSVRSSPKRKAGVMFSPVLEIVSPEKKAKTIMSTFRGILKNSEKFSFDDMTSVAVQSGSYSNPRSCESVRDHEKDESVNSKETCDVSMKAAPDLCDMSEEEQHTTLEADESAMERTEDVYQSHTDHKDEDTISQSNHESVDTTGLKISSGQAEEAKHESQTEKDQLTVGQSKDENESDVEQASTPCPSSTDSSSPESEHSNTDDSDEEDHEKTSASKGHQSPTDSSNPEVEQSSTDDNIDKDHDDDDDDDAESVMSLLAPSDASFLSDIGEEEDKTEKGGKSSHEMEEDPVSENNPVGPIEQVSLQNRPTGRQDRPTELKDNLNEEDMELASVSSSQSSSSQTIMTRLLEEIRLSDGFCFAFQRGRRCHFENCIYIHRLREKAHYFQQAVRDYDFMISEKNYEKVFQRFVAIKDCFEEVFHWNVFDCVLTYALGSSKIRDSAIEDILQYMKKYADRTGFENQIIKWLDKLLHNPNHGQLRTCCIDILWYTFCSLTRKPFVPSPVHLLNIMQHFLAFPQFLQDVVLYCVSRHQVVPKSILDVALKQEKGPQIIDMMTVASVQALGSELIKDMLQSLNLSSGAKGKLQEALVPPPPPTPPSPTVQLEDSMMDVLADKTSEEFKEIHHRITGCMLSHNWSYLASIFLDQCAQTLLNNANFLKTYVEVLDDKTQPDNTVTYFKEFLEHVMRMYQKESVDDVLLVLDRRTLACIGFHLIVRVCEKRQFGHGFQLLDQLLQNGLPCHTLQPVNSHSFNCTVVQICLETHNIKNAVVFVRGLCSTKLHVLGESESPLSWGQLLLRLVQATMEHCVPDAVEVLIFTKLQVDISGEKVYMDVCNRLFVLAMMQGDLDTAVKVFQMDPTVLTFQHKEDLLVQCYHSNMLPVAKEIFIKLSQLPSLRQYMTDPLTINLMAMFSYPVKSMMIRSFLSDLYNHFCEMMSREGRSPSNDQASVMIVFLDNPGSEDVGQVMDILTKLGLRWSWSRDIMRLDVNSLKHYMRKTDMNARNQGLFYIRDRGPMTSNRRGRGMYRPRGYLGRGHRPR